LYQDTPNIVLLLLSELNTHENSFIQGNVKDILNELLEYGNGLQNEELQSLYKKNKYAQRTLKNLETVFEFTFGDKIE